MSIDDLLQKAIQFEKLAQEAPAAPPPKKKTPGGVYNVLRKTLRHIADHPSIIPEAVDKEWDRVFQIIDWYRIPPAQQEEIKRKLQIAKLKQAEEMKRALLEQEYELGKQMTLEGQNE